MTTHAQQTARGPWRTGLAAAAVALMVSLAVTTAVTSSRWVGTVFPGFFLLANCVVASISLPHWSVAGQGHLYQHTVVAVNGQPTPSSSAVYAAVRQLPAGTAVAYTLEKGGHTTRVTLRAQEFTLGDYFLLFGAYLFTGLAIALIGIGVWVLKPAAASLALLILSLSVGLFFLTAADLYGPHRFFRLHVLSEALLPAGFIHLALVFPVDRPHRLRRLLIAAPYAVSAGLAFAYEALLYRPPAYSSIHTLCELYAGLSGLPFVGAVLWHYATTASHLVRQRIRVVFLGFLGAFALPAALTLLSGLTGGEVPVNYSVFTMSLFPLSLGYAIVKHDLFEIDVLLKRTTYYLTLTAMLTLAYVAVVAALNFMLHSSALARSPSFPLLFALAAVLGLNPLRDHLQAAVDRFFFRMRYNPKKVLEATSATLASTLQLEEIFALIWRTVGSTMGVTHGTILLLNAEKTHYMPVYTGTGQERRRLAADHPLIQRLRERHGRGLSFYDVESEGVVDERALTIRHGFARLGVQLIIPLVQKGDLLGVLMLDGKESGAFFSADDRDFLYTLANQSALSIANALAYQEIQDLNTNLETKVAERTGELAHTNSELQRSLGQLEQAYRDLQRSQEHLVRAEKMAALGRLTAGIAHEMNTPLGASLTSLKLVQELVDEYTLSIGDREVTEQDHREIAVEMEKLVRSTQQWTEKAASHIRSLKLHTRDLGRGDERPFSVLQTIEDTGVLLAHRLRLSQCILTTSCHSASPLAHGDPGKLGQVLTNLVANAIDAYKDNDQPGKEIRIAVADDGEYLQIRVQDHGSGITPENLEQIFDEFFSTKPLGEGTGLGLSISRDIISNFFGGTMTVDSTLGQGSSFTLHLPRLGGPGQAQAQPQPPTVPVSEGRS